MHMIAEDVNLYDYRYDKIWSKYEVTDELLVTTLPLHFGALLISFG